MRNRKTYEWDIIKGAEARANIISTPGPGASMMLSVGHKHQNSNSYIEVDISIQHGKQSTIALAHDFI